MADIFASSDALETSKLAQFGMDQEKAVVCGRGYRRFRQSLVEVLM